MFEVAGHYATTWNIGDLSNWSVSNVTNMYGLFNGSAYKTPSFNIGNLNNWNTLNVTDMKEMFYNTGYTATNWSLDLSRWNVNKVTEYTNFNTGSESKVTAPTWVS